MSTPAERDETAETPPRRRTELDTRIDIVRKMANELTQEHFGTGPLAELRRLNPKERLNAPTLFRLLARHEVPEEWLRGSGLRDWALVIHCLALAAPDHLRGEARLGKALHDAGFGEKRFVNLLDASAEQLRDRLPRAVRFLVHRGGRLHSPDIARLVLTPAGWDGYDRLRQRIASDFYRAEYDASTTAAAE